MKININTPEGELQMRELIAAGNMVTIEGGWATVTDAPPIPVPQSVTMRQARLALLQAGKLDAINAAVAAMPGVAGDAARIEWEFSSTVERSSPLVVAMGAELHMTSKELDTLFILAATL